MARDTLQSLTLEQAQAYIRAAKSGDEPLMVLSQLNHDAKLELAALAWFGEGKEGDKPFEWYRSHVTESKYSPQLAPSAVERGLNKLQNASGGGA